VSARGPGGVAALLLLAALPAAADIVLNGNFHTGDDDTASEFTPLDPVECGRYRTYPQTFHLSQDATITGFTLHDAIDTQNSIITIDLDGVQRSSVSCTACDLCEGTSSCGAVTVTLTTGVALSAGDHTVAVVDPSGASGNCLGSNDFGWSKLTLLSSAGTTSVMLSQRRHLGDDNDADDDYDFTGNVVTSANQFYPDAFEGASVDIPFTLAAASRLTDVKLYRLRDINSVDGTVKVDGTQVGTLTAPGNPVTFSTSLLLAAGTHTLTVTSGTLLGLRDDMTWDSTILRFSNATASGNPGFFNAVDVGANVLTGQIQTKVAGLSGTYTLDLYALTGLGTGQLVTYNGTTTVEVLDASNNSGATDIYGCNTAWTVAQTVSSAVAFSGGKAQVTPAFLATGLKEARIKVTDNATGAAGCSLDNFAIRPASLAVVATHGTDATAGVTEALAQTASSGTPVHRAGAPFTITVTGKASDGTTTATRYDGTPDWTEAFIAPATVAGELTISAWSAASLGSRSTDVAKYSEVGAATFTFTDTTWASVDADDTVAAQRAISGTANVGRFIPDHFKLTEGTLAPACTAGANDFSYLGSTLQWATPTTLTARTVDDTTVTGDQSTTTQNYAGDLEKLPASLGQPTYAVYDDPAIAGTPTLDVAGLSVPTIPGVVAGVATVTLPALEFSRALVGAFDAEIAITLPAFTDSDGVAPEENPVVLGSATAGGGIAFAGTDSTRKSQRFGRLYFEPRYGSDRLSMDVPLRAEFFDGITFVQNAADACTSLSTSDVTLTPVGGQTHAVTANGSGLWTVTLTAPMQSGAAALEIPDTSNPTYAHELLLDDIDADGFDDNPQRTVYFGLHGQDERWIYQRDATAD
jgi:hypothetical protein